MEKKQRPVLVTIVCILSFIGFVISFPGIFSPSAKKMGDWYPALLGFFIAFQFISVVGTWHMKKWGVFWYFIIFLLQQAVKLMMNDWKASVALLPVIFLLGTVFYYPRMDDNL